MNKTLLQEILLFGVGGVWGFAVDAGVLWLLIPQLGAYGARVVSFLMAVLATWVFNRSITFRSRQSGRGLFVEFLAYLGSMLFGGALNLGVYSALVFLSGEAMDYPLLPLALGSLAGMLVNFLLSRFLLFRKPAQPLKVPKLKRVPQSGRKFRSKKGREITRKRH